MPTAQFVPNAAVLSESQRFSRQRVSAKPSRENHSDACGSNVAEPPGGSPVFFDGFAVCIFDEPGLMETGQIECA